MSDQEEKNAIIKVLGEYAEALNNIRIEAIPAFYAEDGQFVPDGINKIFTRSQLAAVANTQLKKTAFSIDYGYDEIVIDGDYAFVNASAKTSQKLAGRDPQINYSRDSFTLKKMGSDWKIFRYIFNNVRGNEYLQVN